MEKRTDFYDVIDKIQRQDRYIKELEEENKKLKSDLAFKRNMGDNVRAECESLQNIIKELKVYRPMQKLIELLNEYQKENGPEWISFYEKNGYLECQIEHYVSAYGYEDDYRVDMEYGVEILISKSFGFIKWLVENEKIDFEGKLNTLRFNSLVDQTLDSYYALLMLLSIQDEPIKFLISILKNVEKSD